MRASARAQRGQTIVIALLVLLLLAFVGGLFATIVTRNLQNAGRSNRVQSADFYAEAGVRFANDQLTYSLDGADWRPPLQSQLSDGTNGTVNALPKDPRGLARYNAIKSTLLVANANDPDYSYLVQGFTRYNIGGGRYLLRVTYDPVGLNNPDNPGPATAGAATPAYSDPRARYIKIESVGREGTIDPADPTTYSNAPRTQLNATLVQYKSIGITDYGRFETNPENRSDVMALGVASTHDTTSGGILTPGVFDFSPAAGGGGAATPPSLSQYPIVTTYGASDAYLQDPTTKQLLPNPDAGSGGTGIPGGGSIKANAPVRFFGKNNIYLNFNGTATSGSFNDTVEIAGNLLLDNYQPAAANSTTPLSKNQDASVMTNIAAGASQANDPNYVYPSNDPNFNTHSGAVRDGSSGNDADGNPRSVNRLEPPTLDSVNPVTSLPRYRDIAMNAPPRNTEDTATNSTPTAYPTGAAQYGYGRYLYVDNYNDVQRESSSLVGGYTLIDEWLHRNGAGDAGAKSGWLANFYRPPGVDIVLGRQQTSLPAVGGGTTTQTFYGVRLTRSDVDGAGQLIGWKKPDGTALTGLNTDGSTQSTMTVSYKSLDASNDPSVDPATLGTAAKAAYQANPNNDVVIYAEGNVRVHGVASAASADQDPTAYAGAFAANDDDHLPRHITIVTDGTAYIDGSLLRGNPESTITVLAHDYVCVNTTQFLAGPIVDQNPAGTTPPQAYADPSLRALDFSADDEVLLQEFTLPTPPAASPSSATPKLYISGSSSSAGSASADFDILNPRTGQSISAGGGGDPFLTPVFTDQITTAGAATGGAGSLQTGSLFRTSVDLSTLTTPALNTLTPSNVLQLAVRRSQGNQTGGPAVFQPSTQDFLLERAAILPMDIRIEAVLFAQTRSFFVIPGEWFNTSSDDNTQAFVAAANSAAGASRPGIDVTIADQNRFPFYGQPIDMKITIDGAVSEARPADITAQSAWMLKWGWIPQYHGGLTGATGSTAEPTLRTQFDPSATSSNPLGIGLQIVYNPLAGYPYYTDPANANVVPHYLRTDLYGRPLPFTPKLPVATGLLYAGQNTGESVLQ